MHLILTHEQADFDGIASLLGASLLHPQAVALLPRRMNRNVRSFIDLYGPDLPFTENRDLPNRPIQTITLVDTQSLATPKGMSAATRVNVIDHHPLRPDLPAEWEQSLHELGACTTIFVQALQEKEFSLSFVQATLLLLGIYEDTGALTYASTTPQDIRAAAYLLEHGASLRILANFLNPPLSPEQRSLHDRLLASARSLTLNHQNILIAAASGEEMTEEISSIAHKLRDFLDPDALFLLVQTTEGIRLVARSTTDQINVGQVAAHFGGGGHARAAGALIHPSSLSLQPDEAPLEAVYRELSAVLPQHVRPPITVRRLMSRRPLVLNPETSAQHAAHLIQRYGYEGYPVVEKGRVIGLLTRRAVDRAIAHKLDLKVASLMDAGEASVHPQDTIEHLQKVMASTGWGQIPVTDPESGEVIGIVTRTDLLKTLAGGSQAVSERQNYALRLEAALPPARLSLLRAIAEEAHSRRQAVYIVGGFVRDLLLDRPSLDFDIVVEGDAILLANALAARLGGRVVSHARFGTAKWWIAETRADLIQRLPEDGHLDPHDLPEFLDLITARTEFYDHPTALPTVERSSIKLDLHRRDFTINTLALRLDGHHYGELYDDWGGLLDLRRGWVRVLHSLSFVDDPTRMIRAVRFEQRFHFKIEPRTQQLMSEALPLLRQLSGARLRHEVDLILAETNANLMLTRLEELGLLQAVHPSLTYTPAMQPALLTALQTTPPAAWQLPAAHSGLPTAQRLAYAVWMLQLPSQALFPIADRLRFPADLTAAVQAAQRLSERCEVVSAQPPSQITEELDKVPPLGRYALYLTCPNPQARQLLETYTHLWSAVQPTLSGDDLRARGLPPGPLYRQILTMLRAAWLDQRIHTPAEEWPLVEAWLKDHPQPQE